MQSSFLGSGRTLPTTPGGGADRAKLSDMSDYSQGPGWWQASDGKWYPPEQAAPAAPAAPWGSAPPAGMPYGNPAYQAPSTNGMAIAALVCGIASLGVGFITCGIGSVAAIPAVILGHMSRKQIRESNGTQQGDGMALAGLITGYIGVGVLVLVIILFIIGAASDSGTTNDFGLQATALTGS